MNSREWFTQAMEDARIAWREGQYSSDQAFAMDCAKIAQEYVDRVQQGR